MVGCRPWRQSSNGSSVCRRKATTTASCSGVRVVERASFGPIARSAVVWRLRHFWTVVGPIPWRRASALGVEHRKTRPYTPRTNGMVERFNGRVRREVLGITVASHRDLERLLAGFSAAYDARRQRVLGGRSPEEVVRERLGQGTSLANPAYRPPPDPCVLPKALLVVELAKDVSQPDT